jgi:DNA-binding transcriptional ArsR family regulator
MVDHSSLDHVLSAIADPTRRAILARLERRSETVGEMAEHFPISLNGVSKHVKTLEKAGLVRREVAGREHRLHLDAAALHEAADWIDHYRKFWNVRLDALERLLRARRPH